MGANPLQDCKFVNCVPPGVIKDDASFTPVTFNTMGYRYATFVFLLGATDIAMAALKIQESDTDGSYVDIEGGAPATMPSATNDNGIVCGFIDLEKRKKWLNVIATAGNGSAGTYLAGLCILSNALISPSDITGRNLISQFII